MLSISWLISTVDIIYEYHMNLRCYMLHPCQYSYQHGIRTSKAVTNIDINNATRYHGIMPRTMWSDAIQHILTFWELGVSTEPNPKLAAIAIRSNYTLNHAMRSSWLGSWQWFAPVIRTSNSNHECPCLSYSRCWMLSEGCGGWCLFCLAHWLAGSCWLDLNWLWNNIHWSVLGED